MVFASAREFVRVAVALAAAAVAVNLAHAQPPTCGPQPGFEPGIIPSNLIHSHEGYPTSTLLEHDDGSGPALYATRLGVAPAQSTLPAASVVRLRHKRWERVGYRLDGAQTLASGDLGSNFPGGPRLFACGYLTLQNSAGGPTTTGVVAFWDGLEWHVIPNISGSVTSLTVFDDDMGGGPQLYVCGWQGMIVNGIGSVKYARWNGHTWQIINAPPDIDVHPRRFGIFDMGNGPRLYVGGWSGVALWTGTQWADGGALGSSVGVESMASLDGPNGPEIVLAGQIWIEGQKYSFASLRSDGSLVPIDVPLIEQAPYFTMLATSITDRLGPAVYLGGGLANSQTPPSATCFRYDGVSTSPLADTQYSISVSAYNPANSSVSAFALFDDGDGPAVYGAGYIYSCGDPGAATTEFEVTSAIFRIPQTGSDAGHVLGIDQGVRINSMYHLSRVGSSVIHFAGRDQLAIYGPVQGADAKHSYGIALFDGQVWTPFAPAIASQLILYPTVVQSAFVDGAERLVCTQSYGQSYISYIQNADPYRVRLGPTFGGVNVRALLYFDDSTTDGPVLYCQDNTRVMRLIDGQSQTILNLPEVQTLVAADLGQGPRLFVGARFDDGPGVGVWNGSTWDRLGPSGGFATVPTTLAVHDDGSGPSLYASFESSAIFDGQSAYRIARFDGQSWHPVDTGLTGGGAVRIALASFDDGSGPALYAAGDFTAAGGHPSRGFARLRAGRWEPYLDINPRPGIDGTAISELSLNVLGDTLYLVGAFADTGLRPAGAPTNTESNVIQAANILAIRACPPACFPDLNHDGAIDQTDVDYLINAVSGGDNPTGANLDLDSDDVVDQADVDVLVNVVAGAPCQ